MLLVAVVAVVVVYARGAPPEQAACRDFPTASTAGTAFDREDAVYRLAQSVESEPLHRDLMDNAGVWQDVIAGRPDLDAIQASEARVAADCRSYR